MDLNRRLADAAARRVAVLVVTVPGWDTTRVAVERTLRQRGWRPALSPADADVLLVCGPPGRRLARAVDLVWDQLPGPRARVPAMAASAAGAALDQAVTELLDGDRQRRDATERSTDPAMGTPPDEEPDDEDTDDEDTDDGEGGHEGDGEEDGEDEGGEEDTAEQDHGDMDHGDMDMDMAPGGIPLAGGGGDDRDGLDLDVLHVPLGPVLPCWPAGLLLHCTLAGDVVTEARPEVLGPADDAQPEASPFGTPADRLDRAARLLTLAGWEAAATEATRLRDDLLTGDDDAAVATRLDRLVRRVRRSRLLRWSLRGAGPLDGGLCDELGLDRRAAGDVHDRLVTLLEDARSAPGGGSRPDPVPVAVLTRLLPGRELGAVRLLVASLDLDTGARAFTGTGAS